jgi:hypothetical protein
MNSFAAFGIVTLFLSPVVWTFAIEATAPLSAIQTLRMVFLLAVGMLVGVGLLCRRKWAALYFSLPLFVCGIHEAFFSIEQVTFPYNLLFMSHGLSLTLPLVIAICIWKNLTCGNRFF